MKKLCAIIIGFALLSAFYACQKDPLGVYNPKHKISEIYGELEGHHLQERWIWDGDKLIRINFYKRDGDLNYAHNYIYDGQRVARIESDDLHSDFFYDGKKLTEIKTFEGDELLDTYVFSYEKNRLSHLSINQRSKSAAVGELLPLFIPGYEQLEAERVRLEEEKGNSYYFTSAEIDFIWMGNDVQNMKTVLSSPYGVKHYVFTYVYDNNVNPRYNFLAMSVGQQLVTEDPVNLFFSQHNVIGIYVTDEDLPPQLNTQSLTYSYDYYDKCPTKMYRTYLDNEDYSVDSVLMYSIRY